jgi:hypothetical protein
MENRVGCAELAQVLAADARNRWNIFDAVFRANDAKDT